MKLVKLNISSHLETSMVRFGYTGIYFNTKSIYTSPVMLLNGVVHDSGFYLNCMDKIVFDKFIDYLM